MKILKLSLILRINEKLTEIFKVEDKAQKKEILKTTLKLKVNQRYKSAIGQIGGRLGNIKLDSQESPNW